MKMKKAEKWILWGIPLLFLFGGLMHFLYELTGRLLVVGLFAPVNESIFEHMKLAFLPTVLWWLIYGLVRTRHEDIDWRRWLSATLIASVSALFTIPLLYYFYSGALGTQNMIVDIVILLIALAVGQLLGLHFYRHGRGLPTALSATLLAVLLLLLTLGTLWPPQYPIFRDALTGSYGIFQK